jgi:hypothetical protein
MGLEVRYVAPMLSHQRVGGCVKRSSSLEHKDIIQESFDAVFSRALDSTSMLKRATVFCFRQPHEMRTKPLVLV